jgi:16S rRNA processing protein RimM
VAPAARPRDVQVEVDADDRVEVGYVARAHGVRGELRVATHDPESTSLESAAEVWIGGERFAVDRARRVEGATLVRLEGVDDRDRAETLRGRPVEVSREALGLAEGEVLLADMIGCVAVLRDGSPYGRVVGIDVGDPQSRLVLHDGEVERLVPIVDEIVVEVDLEGARVVLDPPEGLPETPIR